MEISSAVKGNASILTLIGQLWRKEDLTSIEAVIEDVLTVQRSVIVLDINRLSFINSQGLGLLVRCHVKVKDAGGQLILFNPNEAVSEVIELSGFGMFMVIVLSQVELDKIIGS